MSTVVKEKTVIMVKGDKEKARRIRRALWRALVRGEVLPFIVDAYAGEIWVRFDGKENEEKVRQLLKEAETLSFTKRQSVTYTFGRRSYGNRNLSRNSGDNQRGHRKVVLAFTLN
jgi:hypothetical protein